MTTAANPTVQLPKLAEGERYLCGTVNADGTVTHSILLSGDNDKASHEEQLAWAKSIGGDLMNRVELITAYETMPEEFRKDWYWSNTKHVSASNAAWYQDFYYGYQDFHYTISKVSARAVRRLTI